MQLLTGTEKCRSSEHGFIILLSLGTCNRALSTMGFTAVGQEERFFLTCEQR